MLPKNKKTAPFLLILLLLIALFLPAQAVADDPITDVPTAVDGRILPASKAGDTSDWIEIARNGGYSLILRKDVLPLGGVSFGGYAPHYPLSSVRDRVNNWFKNTLGSTAKLRDFTVANNSISQLGFYTNINTGFSKPSATAARSGDDVAFLLTFAEAARFCSTQYYDGSVYKKSPAIAYNNFFKLTPYPAVENDGFWWLRTTGLGGQYPAQQACTVGFGGFNLWGADYMMAAVNQYNYSSSMPYVRPALWVGSGIFVDYRLLSYDANGGNGAPLAQTVPANTSASISDVIPTWEFHEFLGWDESATATAATYQPGGSLLLNRDIKLYAVWKAEPTYTLAYDANGGYDAPPPQLALVDTTITISSSIPSRDSHAFVGWALSAAALSADYQPGDTILMNSNKTLYAVWESAPTYTLSYDANGGSGAPPSQPVPVNTNATISSVTPQRTNYPFLGWALSGTALVAAYQPGDTILMDGNKTLYAVWGEEQPSELIGVDGRILTPIKSGDKVNWVEIARYGKYSLIVRSSYLNIYTSHSGDPTWQYDGYLTTSYSTSSVRTAINKWFNGTANSAADNLPANARMREYTMKNDALSKPGTASTTASMNNGLSLPSNTYVRTGDDVAFALSYGEAANFCSDTHFIRGSNPEDQASGNIAKLNFAKITIPKIAGYCAWLRSVGDVSGTMGALEDYGRAFQIWINNGNAKERGLDYPALWVDSTIFDEYTLSYDANGGSGAPAPQPGIPANTATAISSTVPTRTQANFLGWSVSQTATVPEYQPGDSFNIGVSDKTLYAVWELLGHTVTGLVWPMPVNDLGLGQDFLQLHQVTVELRPTFLTAAAPALSTTAVLQDNDGLAKFTFDFVQDGDYVLYISRPGFITRAMLVSVTAADPLLIELTPPAPRRDELVVPPDNGVFKLWWGDCNGDMLVDGRDIMMILELMALDVDIFDPLYNPACDLNADGRIDGQDLMLVYEMWGRMIWDYPGADDVDIFD